MDAFQALAEPNRRSIVELLARHGKLSASAIGLKFPISAAAISQHLKILREAGIVRVEKNKQQRIYGLNPAALGDLGAWAHQTAALWEKRFDALDNVLRVEKSKPKGGIYGK